MRLHSQLRFSATRSWHGIRHTNYVRVCSHNRWGKGLSAFLGKRHKPIYQFNRPQSRRFTVAEKIDSKLLYCAYCTHVTSQIEPNTNTPQSTPMSAATAARLKLEIDAYKLIQRLQVEHDIKTLDQWYNISTGAVMSTELGRRILQSFDNSLQKLLQFVYRDHQWLPWKFTRVENHFWDDKDNQRQFILWLLKKKYNTDALEGMYTLSNQDILDEGGTFHNHSLFPDYNWLPWKFARTDSNFWKQRENVVSWLEWIRKELKLDTSLEDVYRITHRDVIEKGSRSLLTEYGNIYEIAKLVYPAHPWKPWRFKHALTGWWDSMQNQRQFFNDFRQAYGYTQFEDLYKLSIDEIRAAGGGTLVNMYNNSVYLLVTAMCPEHNFLPWLFHSIPKWADDPNWRTKYMEWLGDRVGFKTMEDWYALKKKHFLDNYGLAILYHPDHRGSPYSVVRATFPEHNWLPWKFGQVSRRWWANRENQLVYIKWLMKECGITTLDDFYKVKLDDICAMKGSRLLQYYNNSLYETLKALFPEHEWLPWKFPNAPNAYWKSKENCKLFLEWFKKQYNIKTFDDFYNVTGDTIMAYGGTSLLLKHKGSVHSILAEAYPEHKWVAFRFSRVPTDYWKRVKASYNNDALRDYLIWLGEQYCGIKFSGNETSDSKELEKWYTVTRTTLPSGSKQMLQQFGGLVKALQTAFPSHPWNPKLFQSKEGTKHQHHLSEITGRMFPSLSIKMLSTLEIANKNSRSKIELDIFIADLRLALEYQGERHYYDMLLYGDRLVFDNTDPFKALYCAISGIKLVEVPYWWDLKEESVRSVVQKLL